MWDAQGTGVALCCSPQRGPGHGAAWARDGSGIDGLVCRVTEKVAQVVVAPAPGGGGSPVSGQGGVPSCFGVGEGGGGWVCGGGAWVGGFDRRAVLTCVSERQRAPASLCASERQRACVRALASM